MGSFLAAQNEFNMGALVMIHGKSFYSLMCERSANTSYWRCLVLHIYGGVCAGVMHTLSWKRGEVDLMVSADKPNKYKKWHFQVEQNQY